MRALYLWCANCDEVTEHRIRKMRRPSLRLMTKSLECSVCKRTRPERSTEKVKDVFGPKGRGF